MMSFLAVFSVFYLSLVSRVHKGLCRIDATAVGSFLKFIAILTVCRVIGHFLSAPKTAMDNEIIQSITLFSTLLVFWEDTFFTLPILILEQYGIPKFVRNILLAASAIAFASGHLAYGGIWAFCTLFYVPFISYRFGKKYGLGTVMVGHVLYDLITVLTANLLG
jgi:hypothetical protein